MKELNLWWKKGWVKNLVFLLILAVLFFTDLGQWTRIQITSFTLRNPSNDAAASTEDVYQFPFEIIDQKGEQHLFSEYKGSYVFVNFWASWCVPCLAEFGSLESFTSAFPEMRFLYITREDQAAFERYLERSSHNLPFYKQGSRTPTLLDHSSIPASFIINPEGNIIYRHFGAADWGDEDVISEIWTLISESN